MPRTSFRVALSLLVTGVFCAPAVLGQGAALPDHGTPADVSAFASGLAQHGYFDLAKDVVKNAVESGAAGDAKGTFEYLVAEIATEEGRHTGDLVKRVVAMKEAIKAFDEWIVKYPKADEVGKARFQIADLSRIVGETIVTQIAKETDATKKEALRTEGKAYFTKALEQAEKRVAMLKDLVDRSTKLNEEYMLMRFMSAKLLYAEAKIFENPKGADAQLLLGKARGILDEFELDEQQASINVLFDARELFAKLLIDDGKLDDALERLSSSVKEMADAMEKDRSVINDDISREIIAGAYKAKAEFLMQVRNPPDLKETIKLLEELQKLMPNNLKSHSGRAAMVTLAIAYKSDGKPKWRDLCEKVFAADPSGAAGAKARELLDTGSASGGAGSGGAGLIEVIRGAGERNDQAGGENALRRLLATGTKSEENAEGIFIVGKIYYNRRLFVDAAVAFAMVADDYPASKFAPDAKSNEALSYAEVWKIDDRAKFWMQKNKDARAELAKQWPDSDQARDATFFLAEDAKRDRRYQEAADLYQKVGGTSPKYGEAQFNAGNMCTDLATEAANRNQTKEQLAFLTAAKDCLSRASAWFTKQRGETLDQGDKKKFRDQAFDSQMRIVRIELSSVMKAPERAAKLLDQIEAEFKDDKDKLGKLWNLRISAFAQQGRGEEAATLLEQKLPEIKDPASAAELTYNVAATVDTDATVRAKANPADPEALKLWKIALRLYSRSVDEASKPGVPAKGGYSKVGGRLLWISNKLNGATDDFGLFNIDPAALPTDRQALDRAFKAFEIGKKSGDQATDVGADVDRLRSWARCAALKGQWEDAVATLSEFQKNYKLFKEDGRVDSAMTKQIPDLPDIYEDLAVAYLRAGKVQKTYYNSATDITLALLRNSAPGGKRYWECRYLYLVALKESSADFSRLDAELDNLEREAPDVDCDKPGSPSKYGIKPKIDELRKFRNKKIINK